MLFGGILKGLFQKSVTGVKTLIHNAQVGKQVLASGAQVTSTATGSGFSTTVTPGGAVQVPVIVWYLLGGVTLLFILFAVLKSMFSKR